MYSLTSFCHHLAGEGDRLGITYSEISENDEIIESNIRKSFVILPTSDENIAVLEAINVIKTYLNKKLPTE